MRSPTLPQDIDPEERTPLVEGLLAVIAHQQAIIAAQSKEIEQLKGQVEPVEAELKKAKKLPSNPQLKASKLEHPPLVPKGDGKRAGSTKRSKKSIVKIDEERIVEPECVPLGAKFNGYREYDVQELHIKAHTIRFKLAE